MNFTRLIAIATAAVIALSVTGCATSDQTYDAGRLCKGHGGVHKIENDGDAFCYDGKEIENPADAE